jgi:hypothetical protein
VIASEPVKLNLGCGNRPKEGFKGIDRHKFPATDQICDLTKTWPWKDATVSEIWMEHVLEHFTGLERVHIFNEMDRVLHKGATATIITPSWASARAYGDFTHQWPPVCEQLYAYLSREWRLKEAPDTDIKFNPEGYSCDLQATVGWSGFHPELTGRSDATRHWWLTFGKEAAFDLMATITKP